MIGAHDFNLERENIPTTGDPAGRWRLQDARGDVGVRAAHGISAEARIPYVCSALRRRSAAAKFLVSRSVLCLAFAQLTFREVIAVIS